MPPLYELSYKIADIVFHLTNPDETVKLRLDDPALRFTCPDIPPNVRITVHWSDLSNGAVTGRKIFDPGLSWKLYEQEDSYLFAFYSPISGPVPYKTARMKRDLSSGEVLLHAPFFQTP